MTPFLDSKKNSKKEKYYEKETTEIVHLFSRFHVESFKNQEEKKEKETDRWSSSPSRSQRSSSNLRRLLSSISLRPPIHLPSLLVVFSSGRGARVRRDCAVSATEFTDMENPFFREKKRTRSRGRGRHRVPASQRENLACFFLFFASFCQFTTSPFFSSPFWAWIEDE